MTPFKRNVDGLIEGFPYIYSSDGRIDWKAHLNVKWLRVKDDMKAEVERKYGKKVADLDLATVADYYLYVTLGGYNEVARLRGFDSLTHSVDYVDGTKAVVTCTIHFVPNVEEPNGLTCAGVASGSMYNINPDFAPFMETIAENRAFVRCVRRALNINIVAAEEMGPKKGEGLVLPVPAAQIATSIPDVQPGFQPYVVLANRCKELKVSFDALKARAIETKGFQSDPAAWTDFSSIDKGDVWTLIARLNTASVKNS